MPFHRYRLELELEVESKAVEEESVNSIWRYAAQIPCYGVKVTTNSFLESLKIREEQ